MSTSVPPPQIVMTPPIMNQAAAHPRRPQAAQSVSLLHSRSKARPHPPPQTIFNKQPSPKDSSEDTSNSPSSLQALPGKGSSGESSNAENWFEKSNNHVRDTSKSMVDNEPPYFLRNNSSSEETSPTRLGLKGVPNLESNGGASSLPNRAGLLRLGTDGSSTDDFRGVIDDLTIENKKLKRRLKKYEKLHDSHLKDEKLFEVRVHGLPPEKKRELEDTLRKFAAGLRPTGAGFPFNGYETIGPRLKTHKTSSSQNSLQHTDSAYASMSASGQGSSAHSATDSRQRQLQHSAAARQHSIHTYLHQIPEGLLPRSNAASMSESAKKKIVVRRLEQVFSGKGAAIDGHQQPLQQQEVSQSAARADRSANEALGLAARQEGEREAFIMRDRELSAQISGDATTDEGNGFPRDDAIQGKDFADSSPNFTLEQRPTRPLDLDLHRAQVPADNLRYMRHLGFSPPDPDSSKSPEDGHGWIYLNLLINMAQLHTINVTADFVRKAVSEMSDKFELSQDGRKIRWKGRPRVRVASSEGGSGSAGDWTGENTPGGPSPRKRPKLTARENSNRSLKLGARSQGENNKLVYTPLFFHKDSTDEADESSSEEDDDDNLSSPFPAVVGGDSSGMTSSGVRTVTVKKNKKHDDGPIIFYNNAGFCTDLSGERKPDGNPSAPPYSVVSVQPLGKPRRVSVGILEKRGPLGKVPSVAESEAMDLSDNPSPASMELSFAAHSPKSAPADAAASPVRMEVTGMGGVWPTDHFSIHVESRHARIAETTTAQAKPVQHKKSLPPKFAGILQHTDDSSDASRVAIDKQVLSSTVRELPPSRLPPAVSYMRFGEDSVSDDGSEEEDEGSISPESPGGFPPSAAPQLMDMPQFTDSEEDEDEDDDDDESDGSLDLLASARQVDPDAIRAREREYDAEMADRLADEIPAGSSAATAGGGSGFASPGSHVGRDEYHRAMRESRARVLPLQPTRGGDSSATKGRARKDSDQDMVANEDMEDVAS